MTDNKNRGAPLKMFCYNGHPMSDAHVTHTPKGVKRTCRKCRSLRQKQYIIKRSSR